MAIAAREFPEFVPGGVDPDVLMADPLYIIELRGLQAVIAGFQKAVEDTLFVKTATQWKAALDVYASLSRQVSHHPELEPLISSMTTFLAKSPAQPASTTEPTPAPATDPSPAEPTPIVPVSVTPAPTPAVNG